MTDEATKPHEGGGKILEDRRANMERLRAMGVPLRPTRYERTHAVTKAVDEFSPLDKDALAARKAEVAVPGRITALRRHGKAAFADISDGRSRLQIYVKRGVADERSCEIFDCCDLGDFVGVKGVMFRTKMGELTIEAHEISFLSKALRPLPEKWHGLADVETRYRRRYLDLLANEEVRLTFEARTLLTRAMREFLDARDYLEVETPMMHTLAGGATAKPFRTRHNALGLDLYLRVAPELHLKRLVVGGFERIYEINRNFRNEGISQVHNPEFTMMELYQCYSSFEDLIVLAEEMLTHCVERAAGNLETEFKGNKISWKRPFARMRYAEALERFVEGFAAADIADEKKLRALAAKRNIELPPDASKWNVLDYLFSHAVEPHLIQPTFVTHLPRALSPLAKAEAPDSPWAGRFEIYAGGMEIANAYSEQNDPGDQRAAFEAQAAHDPDAKVDEDYLLALEHGMPPAGGLGVGMDRFAMVATGAESIREVIFFPLLRPKAEG